MLAHPTNTPPVFFLIKALETHIQVAWQL